MYSVNLVLTGCTFLVLPFPSVKNARLLCSVVVLIIWLKLKDFLRLFDTTAFFIKLIEQTIEDIIPFMMIFPFFLYSIGTSVYILNMSRGDDDQIMDQFAGHWVFDVFVNQYLLALGDWDAGLYSGENSDK